MSGWLVAKPYEWNAGIPTHEVLFAVWDKDREAALRMARAYGPQGSNINPYIVAELGEAMLHGLRLRPGQAAILHADRPWI